MFLSLNLNMKIFCLSFLLLSACSSRRLIRDSEYKYSVSAAKTGNIQKAITEFPKKEKGGFITSIEKAWLQYWQDSTRDNFSDQELAEKQLKSLQLQSSTLNSRNYLSVSKEAENFFFQESEDGYIPAEHEIIIMHLLSAQYFIKLKKWDAAEVELRKATFFLQSFFPEGQSHFDDPALRIWLAGLWVALGFWEEAQVDFRKAYELTENSRYLELANLKIPPKELELEFFGIGPNVNWNSISNEPDFINDKVNFAKLCNQNQEFIIESTYPWNIRHKQRNNAIHDILMKSKYMSQFIGIKSAATIKSTAGHTMTGAIKVGSISVLALATAGAIEVMKIGSNSLDAYLKFIGGPLLLASLWIWDASERISMKIQNDVVNDEQESFEELKTYRFVRFLPEAIGIGINLMDDKLLLGNFIQAPMSRTKVILKHNLF